MNKQLPIPSPLDLSASNVSAEWKTFKQCFFNYELASGSNAESDEKRTAIFLKIIGKDALKVYNTFSWNQESDKQKINEVISKFEEYCNPRKKHHL